jgi:hypothetical protein
MLLFGVLIFSFIMNEYIALLDNYKEMMKDFDQGDELRLFFGTLTHFNYNEELKRNFTEDLENYFFYRWVNFKNRAIKEDDTS